MRNQYQHNADGSTIIFYYSSVTKKILATYIDTEDFEKVSSIENTWFICKNNPKSKYRVKAHVNGSNIYLYRYILSPDGDLVVDHIDGNPLNNRKSNLRVVTQQYNIHNQKPRNNLPRHVVYNPRDNKYRVTFVVDGKRKSFGQYHTIEEAEKVAIEARRKFMPGAIN